MEENLQEQLPQGEFFASLTRNNTKIKKDRAASIMEDAQLAYKRSIEDMEMNLKKFIRDRANMLDLSPDNVTTLKVASDFDAQDFVDTDKKLTWQIDQLKIALALAKERFTYLFGA